MKLLEKLDSSFAGLICLAQSKLMFSDPRVQQINYLSNQLISQGSNVHERQENRELLCFTQLFGREFFFISKQFEGPFKGLHNLETIEQLTQKISLKDIKIALVPIDIDPKITEDVLSYLNESFPDIQIELIS